MNILLPQERKGRIKLLAIVLMFALLMSGASITSASSSSKPNFDDYKKTIKEKEEKTKSEIINFVGIFKKNKEEKEKTEYADEDNGVNRTCDQPNRYKGEDGHCHCKKGYVKVLDADAEHRCQYAPCNGVKEEAEELAGKMQELQAKYAASQARLKNSRAELQKYSLLYSNGTTSTARTR